LAGEEILAKQVELLSAAVPKLKKVTVLMNGANPANGFFFDAMSSRARLLACDLIVLTSRWKANWTVPLRAPKAARSSS
jgi:hypothetical protein